MNIVSKFVSHCLQDVVLHSKKLNKKSKSQLEEMVMVDKQGIKGLSKERRKKLEAYQHLFYLLQVSQGRNQYGSKLLKKNMSAYCILMFIRVNNAKRFPMDCSI